MISFKCMGFIRPCKECMNEIPIDDNSDLSMVECSVCGTCYFVEVENNMVARATIVNKI